jgi:hypothetical protein
VNEILKTLRHLKILRIFIKDYEDWYRVRREDIDLHGGGHLLFYYYDGVLYNALQKLYPEYPWKFWRFQQVPRSAWKERATQRYKQFPFPFRDIIFLFERQFFDWLGEQLGIREKDSWYKVTLEDIQRYGGGELLQR